LKTPEEAVASQSLSSSAVLTITNIIVNAVLGLSSLLVARLLGPQNYGIYTLALSSPFFIQLLIGMGVSNAITRFSSYHLAKGDIQTARRMTRNGIAFVLLSGISFTVITIILSPYLATFLLHRSEITTYVEIASFFIVSQAAFSCVSLGFIGWGSPSQVAIWNITQAFLKLLISVTLILAGFNVLGALYGYLFSLIIVGTLGTVSLYVLKFRNRSFILHKEEEGRKASGGLPESSTWALRGFTNDVKEMMRYGLPSFIGSIILNVSQQPVLVIILSAIATNAVIGYYSAASVISIGVAMVAGSFTTSLFPAFSRLEGMNSDTRTAFRYAVKYVSYALMPALFFLIASSDLVVGIFYGQAYTQSSYYLELLTLSLLPLAFGQTVLPAYFMGVGKTRFMMQMNFAETLATLVPVFVLLFWFKLGIVGLLYSIIISNIAPTALGLYSAKKYLGASVDYSSLLKTALISAFCFLVILGLSFFSLGKVSQGFAFVLELIVFFVMYLTLAPLVGVVKVDDLNRLKKSSNGVKALNRILDPILNYERFLIGCMERL
jgi:stage V sporulation protein B